MLACVVPGGQRVQPVCCPRAQREAGRGQRPPSGASTPPPFLPAYREHRGIVLCAASVAVCVQCGSRPRNNRRGFGRPDDGVCSGTFAALQPGTASAVLRSRRMDGKHLSCKDGPAQRSAWEALVLASLDLNRGDIDMPPSERATPPEAGAQQRSDSAVRGPGRSDAHGQVMDPRSPYGRQQVKAVALAGHEGSERASGWLHSLAVQSMLRDAESGARGRAASAPGRPRWRGGGRVPSPLSVLRPVAIAHAWPRACAPAGRGPPLLLWARPPRPFFSGCRRRRRACSVLLLLLRFLTTPLREGAAPGWLLWAFVPVSVRVGCG